MRPNLKPERPSQAFSYHGLSESGLEGMDALVCLGLTARQACVYLALLKLGESRARAIAVLALVPRQEVYRLLEDLKQMGLVRISVAVPTSYSPAPLNEAVKLLLEQRTNEIVAASKRAKQLAQKLHQTDLCSTILKPCFGVVYEGDRGKDT